MHPRLVPAARTALEAGAPILTDAHMVASGVTRARLPHDNDVVGLLRDARVPDLARRWGTTRSAAAVSLWVPFLEGEVVAIGCPVGFIGAAESKQALESFADDHGIDLDPAGGVPMLDQQPRDDRRSGLVGGEHQHASGPGRARAAAAAGRVRPG